MLDIRTPIGLMFLILGVLLGVYGVFTPAQMYQVSLGINLNLFWGGCMAAFGVVMLVWQRLAPHEQPQVQEVEMTSTIPAEQDGASVL